MKDKYYTKIEATKELRVTLSSITPRFYTLSGQTSSFIALIIARYIMWENFTANLKGLRLNKLKY